MNVSVLLSISAAALYHFLPVACISVSRISHPNERLSLSARIYVVIKSIDPVTGRICVTHRELLGTWEENAAMFAPGQTVAGIVRSVEDYGAFVELTPNLTGLAEPRDDIVCGQSAAVYIKSITPERMKIRLPSSASTVVKYCVTAQYLGIL